ncbi:MAG TPA: bifunctional diguanylate cyclase/phosphodiesterase [Albitalea sp.]|nr:bifunctional diguanylate cyclase/phosphodiesterase [Albitalea sp.]
MAVLAASMALWAMFTVCRNLPRLKRLGAAWYAHVKGVSIARSVLGQDAESGLPNRAAFNHRVKLAVHRSLSNDEGCAVLCVEVNGLRAIDALLEADFEGRVIHEVANLVSATFRRVFPLQKRHVLVARTGERTLGLLVPDCDDRELLGLLAERLVERIASMHSRTVEKRPVVLTACVGVADMRELREGTKVDLLWHAEIAMQRAAAEGSGKWLFFKSRILLEAREQNALLSDLRGAIRARQFRLHYQPQVDASKGRIVAVEALLRWQHPSRGLISPESFVPVAESFGLIDTIGDWVIEEACRQAAEWYGKGLRLRLAINLSVIQLRRPDIVERILGALSRHGIPPHRLTCEITESVALDHAHFSRTTLARLAASGIQLSIDDFGTGYSSLGYLHQLPVGELKIDRTFVSRITTNATTRAVLTAIFEMARTLGVRVVAEGVETPEQRDLLLRLGADQFQGYLYAKPMSGDALLRWAHDDRIRGSAFCDTVFKHSGLLQDIVAVESALEPVASPLAHRAA